MSTILGMYGTIYVVGFFLTAVVVACIIATCKESLRIHMKESLQKGIDKCIKNSKIKPKNEEEAAQMSLKEKEARANAMQWSEGGRFTFICFLLVMIQSLLWPLLLIEVLATMSMYKR